jgi:hypothetical protein
VRYHIRAPGSDGELTVPDGAYLVMLVRQKFLEPDDEVRREGSQHWRKIREVPEYAQMLRGEKRDASQFTRVFITTSLMFVALILLLVIFRAG